MLAAQLVAVQLLIKLADGDDAAAASDLASILDAVPLGGGVSEQFLRNHLTLPYVLVPSTRDYWDQADLGPSHVRARMATRAFVRAHEDGDLGPLATMLWPEPGFLAANFPVRWAMELALHGVRAGRHEGRLLATWLCEHWGDPARIALRSWVDHDVLGETARDLVARTPSPPPQRVEARLLGQLDLLLDGHSTADPDWRRERVRGLLAWLVLNPVTSREQAAGALWPDLPIDRAAKNLRTTLNYLHHVLEPRRSAGDATWFVRIDGNQMRLHSDLDVDLWRFGRLLDGAERAERHGHPGDALPQLIEAVGLWTGDLAADLDHEWLDLERIHVRSRFVRGCCRAAELLVATGRPDEAIEAITPALASDPWHEPGYLVLADAYAALGDVSSARAIIQRAEDQLGELTTTAGRRRASDR
jgi:DNA-binding SARP family transcriptional activator